MQEKIRQLLMGALAAQQRGDLGAAEKACRETLEVAPDQPDALQFLGLIEETKGNLEKARELMEKSLSLNPRQPHVLNNLGNLFHKTGESEKALEFLTKALELKPDYWDAWYNLGKIHLDLDHLEEAEEPLKKARQNWPHKDPRPHTLLGSLYQRKEDYDLANKYFEEALKIKPDHFNTLHNYGLSLKMQQRHADALELYRKAEKINPGVPELFYNFANAYYELNDIDRAVSNYEKALELKPDYIEAHTALNEILWRAGKKDNYVSSYRKAIRENPDSLRLRLNFLDSLIKADHLDEAEDTLAESLQKFPGEAELWHIRARLSGKTRKGPEILSILKKCIELDPENVLYRKDIGKVLIKMGRLDEALEHMKRARELAPFNQEILAYLGLCWQLLDNEKARWLQNYDQFVRAYKIPVPPGYKDIGEFNRALNKALDKFHTSKEQPSDQTLRGGTQTIAALLDKNVKEIKEARKSFEQTIARYVSDLPDDPDHPLLSRKSDKFTFSGSWSVRLRDEGFHVNHTHPEGWLSSCYYVALPDVVKKGKDREGWIKFGESPLELGNQEKIGKIVQPEEGLLVLFPSYMFHGTFPFHSKQTRTTLPFDVVPL